MTQGLTRGARVGDGGPSPPSPDREVGGKAGFADSLPASNPSSATCQPSDLLQFLISLCLSFLLCKMEDKNSSYRELPGGPWVRTLDFHCCGPGLIPSRGTKIL